MFKGFVDLLLRDMAECGLGCVRSIVGFNDPAGFSNLNGYTIL